MVVRGGLEKRVGLGRKKEGESRDKRKVRKERRGGSEREVQEGRGRDERRGWSEREVARGQMSKKVSINYIFFT